MCLCLVSFIGMPQRRFGNKLKCGFLPVALLTLCLFIPPHAFPLLDFAMFFSSRLEYPDNPIYALRPACKVHSLSGNSDKSMLEIKSTCCHDRCSASTLGGTSIGIMFTWYSQNESTQAFHTIPTNTLRQL